MVEFFKDLLAFIRDPGPFIEWGGLPLLALVIFLETGMWIFFLPGDSLLVVAGAYAASGHLNILTLNLVLIPCAILGDAVSYWMGAKLGPKVFSKPRSRFFKPEHMVAAHAFYEKHGGKAIVLARFVPIVRTFVPIIAGAAKMPYRKFALYNITGGASWIVSMTVVGYFLGQIPFVRKRLEIVIIAVVFLSVLPIIIEIIKAKRRKPGVVAEVKEEVKEAKAEADAEVKR